MKRSPARWLTAAIVLVLLFLATFFLIGAISTSDDGWRHLSLMDEIEEEDVMYFPDHELFLVHREGGTPVALSAIDPHLGHRDAYCRSSGQFQGIHGEKYDRLGFYSGGPAPRGLDRYAVRVADDRIEVEVTDLIQGKPRSAGPKHEPIGDFCFDTAPQAPEGFL